MYLILSLLISGWLFSGNKAFAMSSGFYPPIKVPTFEAKYDFLTKLWFHTKAKEDLDYYLSPFVLIADKREAKLYLYFYNGTTKLIKSYDILTGRNHGNKQETGDLKTPEGIYFFKNHISKHRLAERYGSLAITINFPNNIDKIENKDGGGIWLHGIETMERIEKKFDTKGCIAARNIDVENIIEFIQAQTTPIIILDRFIKDPSKYSLSNSEILNLHDFINKWKKAWKNKDLEAYISFYSDDFMEPLSGKNLEEWKEYKKMLNKRYRKIDIKIRNISIYSHPHYWLVQFIQEYNSETFSSTGLKRLYIDENHGRFKIKSEEFVNLPKIKYLGKAV